MAAYGNSNAVFRRTLGNWFSEVRLVQVWGHSSGDTVFQGRLVNRVSGQYKDWQLSRDEWPGGIDQFDWERRHGGD